MANQVLGTYQLTQCKYDYNSIAGLTLGGVRVQNNPLAAVGLLTSFTSPNGTLPLEFTLNLDVTNPGIQTAFMHGLSYILEIDGTEMTRGVLHNQIQVNAGQKTVLPIAMAFDLKQVLKGKSLESIKNLAFNFAGIGNASSQVTFKLKPNFLVGSAVIPAPNYIPVSFTI
ncbi:hypothetical protein AGMMS49525_00480 [Bacteroidia bacterium]|nr:hypothetical protein AGMMS49525_00480 [Bacteroidia bacterium]